MPRPKNLIEIKHKFCHGCYQDRYNHKGLCERPGIDAPVLSENCWHLKQTNLVYCRPLKQYAMRCHSGHKQQWVSEYALKKKKPDWKYY